MERDSVLGTLVVATVLCVVCSVLVSTAAVGLRSQQEKMKALDQRKNILLAAGLAEDETTADEVQQIYEARVKRVLVDLGEGTVVPESQVKYEEYNQRDAADSKKMSEEIDVEGATPGVDRREKYAFVYQILEGEDVVQYVLPVYGKGLWSTLYGFLAIDADGRTIRGITFYEHGETPGLGGEITSPLWKAKWSDPDDPKYAYDEEGAVVIGVIKGQVDPASDKAKYQVDGLSGATITSNGVSNLVKYWLGPDAFGPYLKNRTSA